MPEENTSEDSSHGLARGGRSLVDKAKAKLSQGYSAAKQRVGENMAARKEERKIYREEYSKARIEATRERARYEAKRYERPRSERVMNSLGKFAGALEKSGSRTARSMGGRAMSLDERLGVVGRPRSLGQSRSLDQVLGFASIPRVSRNPGYKTVYVKKRVRRSRY